MFNTGTCLALQNEKKDLVGIVWAKKVTGIGLDACMLSRPPLSMGLSGQEY